jgi:hypothetical protein
MKSVLVEIKKLFSGSDGEWSIRRILGAFLLITGTILVIAADKPDTYETLAVVWSLRGLGIMLIGIFLFGWITIQNMKDIAKNGINTVKDGGDIVKDGGE